MATLGRLGWISAWAIVFFVQVVDASVPPTSAEVKAAFLFNFATFVEWPAETVPPDQTFRIGVCAAPEIADALEKTVAGERVRGRVVQVVRIDRGSKAGECHILYLAPGGESFARVETLRGKPVLTVGDDEHFESRGGMVRFVTDRNRVRLRINLEETDRAGLRISSQLLRIAEVHRRS